MQLSLILHPPCVCFVLKELMYAPFLSNTLKLDHSNNTIIFPLILSNNALAPFGKTFLLTQVLRFTCNCHCHCAIVIVRIFNSQPHRHALIFRSEICRMRVLFIPFLSLVARTELCIRYYLTICLGLVEWCPFDSILSI